MADEPIGPVEALERIAYLMERRRESTPKVKAFRKAAATVRALGDEEVAARVKAGSLTAVAGIGASTGAVITQAVNGERPSRLVEMEADAKPLATGGRSCSNC